LRGIEERMLLQSYLDTDKVPWVPLGPGKSFKPLLFLPDDRGWVQLLRLEPGTLIPRHRHTGEVHAWNVRGSRRLATGELVGPGGYVYEPAGNEDWWQAVGDEPLVVHIVVYGAVEYLDDEGRVTKRVTATALEEIARKHFESLLAA
jgi:quercetin dioxygenase-like cupin family protein